MNFIRNERMLGAKLPFAKHRESAESLAGHLNSQKTKETLHRGLHGPDFGHAISLFDPSHQAGNVINHANKEFSYHNHLGNKVKVPKGWKVDTFGQAYDPTKPHAF